MKKIEESKNGNSKSGNGDESGAKKKVPIIQTLKPKKRLTKDDKELIEVTKKVMDAIIR